MFRGQTLDLGAADFYQRMAIERPGNSSGKSVTVHGQCAAGRNLIGIGSAHDEGVQAPHFGMEQPDRVVGSVIGAE